MTELELVWLAGLLEGEGAFLHGPPSAPNQPRIALNMTDLDVVERVSKMFNVKYLYKVVRNPDKLNDSERKNAEFLLIISNLVGLLEDYKKDGKGLHAAFNYATDVRKELGL